ADESREQRARLRRPELRDERDAQRPFAAHAERRDEAEGAELPRRPDQAAEPGEDRVAQDAPHHRLHAPDAVAEPAEEDAARGGPDEEAGDDAAEPEADVAFGAAAQELAERGPSGDREEADFQPV